MEQGTCLTSSQLQYPSNHQAIIPPNKCLLDILYLFTQDIFYDFIVEDSYVELKRNSSLLPPEVIAEVFKLSQGNSITLNSRDGDVYIIDLLKINSPSSEFIDSIYDQYSSFSEQRISSNIAEIINEDLFESAKVNLSNLVF